MIREDVINPLYLQLIDSYQKLNLLLLLQRHPDLHAPVLELAERLHLRDLPLLEKILDDLGKAGLLSWCPKGYKVVDNPAIRQWLDDLAKTFSDPLARQQLLNRLQVRPVRRTVYRQTVTRQVIPVS